MTEPVGSRVEGRAAAAGGRARRAAEASRSAHELRSLLAADSPGEVLERIHAGDPLGLRARVAERLEARALLLDPDRAWLRSLAYCARYARRLGSKDALDAWLAERVDEALLDLVREDDERMRLGSAPEPRTLADTAACAEPLGLDPRRVFEACAAFNRLAPDARLAFFRLVLHGRGLDEAAEASRTSATTLARAALRAFRELLAHAPAPRAEQGGAPPGGERTS